ncbi:hypothetical protein SAMN05216299_12338 [Nitrosospira sp. Nsp14]|nr:hypothetical protein SAMN05216299_12338 [Nitrosospira sp. Nsp14]
MEKSGHLGGMQVNRAPPAEYPPMNASEATVIILSSNVAYAKGSSLDKTVGRYSATVG